MDPAISIVAATDLVLNQFENPADPEVSRAARRNLAQRALGAYQAHHPPAVLVAP
jgi:hypothetical protein